jgi:predicted dehydrogenase
MEGFMFRHHPQMRRLAELVGVAGGGPSAGPGTIGRLRMIRAAFSFPLADPGNIRLAGALDGGALMDVGCYCVSAARLLAGEPRRVYAERALGGEDVDLTFSATMRFDADVLAHFDAGIALAPRSELEVVGEEGSLWLPDPWHGQEPVIEWRGGEGHTERIEVERASSFRLEVENFSAAIRGQGEPLLGREDALAQARALHALALSAAEHQPVGLLG